MSSFVVWVLLPDGWSLWHCIAVTTGGALSLFGFYCVARNWGFIVTFGGGLLNKICMLANGGYMPVSGFDQEVTARGYKWTVLTSESRLTFLADIYNGASIGDGIVTFGVLLTVGIWLQRKLQHRKLTR